MSGQLSTTYEIGTLELTTEHRVFRSRSLSGKRFSRIGEYHLWRLKVSFNAMPPSEARALIGFLNSQRGGYETFTIIPDGLKNPLGDWGGSVTVNSVIDSNTILMNGFTNNNPDAVKAGDIFTLAGDTKVYMVDADYSSDGLGQVTVNFSPDLIRTPTGGTAVTHTNCAFTVELDSDSVSFSRSGFFYNNFTIDLVEALT